METCVEDISLCNCILFSELFMKNTCVIIDGWEREKFPVSSFYSTFLSLGIYLDSLRILPIRIWTWVTSVWMIHEPIWDTGDLGSTRPQASQEPKGTHLEIIVLHRVDQKEQIITSWQAWKLLSQFETMIHLLLNRLLTWTTSTHRKKITYFSFLKTAVHQKTAVH